MKMPGLIAALICGCLLATPALAASDGEEAEKVASPGFTEDYLQNADNIEVGRVVWEEQCQYCHGAKAYPGKAPKLKPRRYTADFVFDRVANGFRKMPAWNEVYTMDELMGVTAWIMSDEFSP